CATSFGMSMNYLYVTYAQGRAQLQPFQSYSGIQGSSTAGPLDATIPNQQARQMDDDALAILNDKPVMVPGEEGLRDIRVVEAVYEAARTGDRVEVN
ncbi:MAG: Gfo/Idh/MocA family oxidoreductase, partial [Saprospiraceae bacterium]|nr:Gfo/Idh/MocA family oxidoreductase [Saprospiraceae bacterium]